MLQYQNSPLLRSPDGGIEGVSKAEVSNDSIRSVLDFLSRRYREIGIAAAIGFTLGLVYLLTATPTYTATASMIIDSNKMQLFQQGQSAFSDAPMDTSAVDSQVEVLKSETIALAVIKQLHLTEDPEFVGSGGGLIGTLLNFVTGPFGSSAAESDFAVTREAINVFQNRLGIR